LFLDEIAELVGNLQAKLLRAVQERVIGRLGSNAPIPVNIRLVTATAKNLEQAVAEGRSREDLYYRLNVVSIELPPLRERRQDVPALVQQFLRRSGQPVSMTLAALSLLCDYHWPGNVRELENTIARALVLARGNLIACSQIQLLDNGQENRRQNWADLAPLRNGRKESVESLERSLVERASKEASGNKSKAAEVLGIHRRLLYEKLRQYGLERKDEL
jgi:two-component system NtrC family response regulator